MDDILIFGENQEELEERTKQVLQRLREHDLFLKPKKCEFNKTTMEYLGLIIQEGKLSMDPVKLSGIRDWPTPTTVKLLRFSLSSVLYIYFLPPFPFLRNLAYIIPLIPGHESPIYDLHYLSLTHVPRFDSFCTINRYDSSIALTHIYSI
jgi:Reverse transcriptase (RNA-dependent DNA polymerase)